MPVAPDRPGLRSGPVAAAHLGSSERDGFGHGAWVGKAAGEGNRSVGVPGDARMDVELKLWLLPSGHT
ncbi:hypothetical protein GCM10010495_68730 [Kitasatospora herbaricolor]|nr:hypothetical protein GCM10010495_68730 [Kitasatospora herbaricolor]